ncbi:hypothetical protein E1B28_004526 [Marasmius oreades]|uniref:DUF4187 domain-containing protein n=1 Tax=Marasmius oreades TaxID=181124 RepID=A0A9P7UYT4_9AGAR|nr:uncharacterized protein E1B28_004526 [Marasmius oreades]KAG7097148.1 hypothetical protein E1B28_004526 [Marasmius oreades]
MSDEDDYLSDKFIIESTIKPSGPQTYSQIRKDAQKRAQLKKEQTRNKSQREIREEALNKSLFERAKEEEPSSGGNKALMMMMKMGFKPGQSLGKVNDEDDSLKATSSNKTRRAESDGESLAGAGNTSESQTRKQDDLISPTTIAVQPGHRTEPIPLNEWSGRQGIGTSRKLKRGAPSTSEERVAKMAKMEKEAVKAQDNFRVRTRLEYLERRAEGQLGPAQRTCVNLDEKAGKKFNVLWLNPENLDSFSPGLVHSLGQRPQRENSAGLATRLRKEMESDALSSVTHDYDDLVESNISDTSLDSNSEFSQNVLDEASQFLRLQARDRLELVLTYLRDEYAYCFWCGTEYEGQEEMEEKCPGVDEECHD